MKVVFVSFIYDDGLGSEEELIQRFYTTTGWAEVLQKKGIEVAVVQRFTRESSFKRNEVQYHFIKDHFRGNLKRWQVPLKFIRKVCELNADVIHTNSTLFTPLLRILSKRTTAIIIQHHGGPGISGMKRVLFILADSFADGLFFTTVRQGEDWYENKRMIRKIMPVMEGSSFFRVSAREDARKKTGISGNPVFIWAGHLNVNKDPITVLDGFIKIFTLYPEAKLVMVYGGGPLLAHVTEKINADSVLQRNTILIGKVHHQEMEDYFNSADYFVLGSHYEGSGYALCEALACGCIPVVTSIPSFSMMTDGRLGALWQAGDKDSFAEAVIKAMNKPLMEESKACRDFFDRCLSFDAISEIAAAHYEKVVMRRFH